MRFRSVNSYQIEEEKHKHFLLEKRNDPVTGDSFLEGDEVVFCSTCKSAFLKDSWVYMGNRHCDQRSTLPIFPKSKKLTLQKPIELPFVFANTDQRVTAFSVDISVLIGVCIGLFVLGITFNFLEIEDVRFYVFLCVILFTFRDSILKNRSIGKAITGLYFIDTTTNLPATIWQTLGRNLLFWIMNGVFALTIMVTKSLQYGYGNIGVPLFFVGAAVVITNIYYVKQNLENSYSWFDKLLGIRLVKMK